MAKRKDAHLHELTRLRAKAYMNALVQEARLLIALFPDLRDSFDSDELPVTFILQAGRDQAVGRKVSRKKNAG